MVSSRGAAKSFSRATVPRGLAVAMLAALVLTLCAAPAGATITYEKNAASAKPTIWVAEDNGGGVRELAKAGQGGFQPLISPDGSAVIFSSQPARGNPALQLVSTAGGAISSLAANEQDMTSTAWSPNSQTIATVLGATPEHERLVLINVAARTTRVVASGSFQGVSFSPDSTQLAYSRAPNQRSFPTSSDIYVVSIVAGAPVRLTSNHRSSQPVWGPTQIAFARSVKPKRKQDFPKSNIWLMNPNGSNARQLTRQKAPFLTAGPSPLGFSADGTRLLAEFTGQDVTYGEGVLVSSGAVHTFGRTRSVAFGLMAAGISRDGSTVLGATGGFEPGPNHNVVTVPFAGGPATVIVRDAFSPSWNG
jgi:Tol biopolymer transport system component